MKVETAETVGLKDAVVALLNAGSDAGEFSQQFVAQREYDPEYELEDLEHLHVTVLIGSVRMTRLTRGGVWQRDYEIHVAIERRSEDRQSHDELMKAPEEIVQYCSDHSLAAYPAAGMIGGQIDPVYTPALLRTDGTFFSVARLTYRTVR